MPIAELDLCTLQEDELLVMTETQFLEMIECFDVPTISGNEIRLDDRVTYQDGFRATSVSINDGPTLIYKEPRVNPERRNNRRWL